MMKKLLLKELKDLEDEYISGFKVLDFALEPHFPKAEKITSLPCDKYEFLYDIDIDYTGTILLELEAQVEIKNWVQPTPLHARVAVKQLKGTLRVCFVPTEFGASWLCFVEEPKISCHIDLEYGENKKFFGHIPQVAAIVQQLLSNVLKEVIYPERVELDIPMSIAKVKKNKEPKPEQADKAESPRPN